MVFTHGIFSLIIIIIVGIELVVNCVTQSIAEIYVSLPLSVVQVALILVIGALQYGMCTRTLKFKAGMFLEVLRLTRFFLITFVFHLLFSFSIFIIRVYYFLTSLKDPRLGWEMWWYWLLMFGHNFSSIAYYCSILVTVSIMSDPNLFIPRSLRSQDEAEPPQHSPDVPNQDDGEEVG